MSSFVSAAATVIKAVANGAPNGGAINIPGLQVGDMLIQAIPYGFPPGQAFEQVVSVADELQQIPRLDWSTVEFTFYLLRGV
jgi:hypothetical protein